MADKPTEGPASASPTAGSVVHAVPSTPSRDLRTPAASSQPLVEPLIRTFREQVRRSLHVELDDSITSLAFVDYYLSQARDEDREPIVSLIAAGAGAYFGELVRHHIGATWVGDGEQPRRLRLLLEPQFIYFSPVDQAYEAIAGKTLTPDDPRIAAGPPLESTFGLRPAPVVDDTEADQESEAAWLNDRLAELPPIPDNEFHSLTGRFETLQVMLELLAAKNAAEGYPPRRLGLPDYVEVLTQPASSRSTPP